MASDPDLSTLRWLLGFGLAVRLLLAPITSWGIDTPSFLEAATRTAQVGSPYPALFINPPLGPFVQAPIIALLALAMPASSFVQYVPALGAVVSASPLVSTAVPTPAALLAMKLPLILADVGVGAGLFTLLRPLVGARAATWSAALWLLNPLTIWVSAVHAEYDPLGALAIVALAASLLRRSALGAGASLGFGTMAKLVPMLALPFVLAYFAAPGGPTIRTARAKDIALLAIGVGLSILPFAAVLPGYGLPVAASGSAGSFGGVSLFVAFNPAVTSFATALGTPASQAASIPLFRLQQALAVVGIVGAAGMAVVVGRRKAGAPWTVSEIGVALLWALAGGVLLDAAPQSENFLIPLVAAVLAAPILGRRTLVGALALSAGAVGLYWALLTPVAYFYPLWVRLGPSSVEWANHVAIGYATSGGPISQGPLWLVCGVLGGAALLYLWAIAAAFAIRRPAPDGRGGP